MIRALAFVELCLLCASVFVPTHTLDHVMLMEPGYLWGSLLELNLPVLSVLFVAQPVVLVVTAGTCLWTLGKNRGRALLFAVAGLQVLLGLAGWRAWAIDGVWWGTWFFAVSQGLCVLLFLGSVVVVRSQARRPGERS